MWAPILLLVYLLVGCVSCAQPSMGKGGQPPEYSPSEQSSRPIDQPVEKPERPSLEARRFLTGDGVLRDRARAWTAYLAACKQGDRPSCVVIYNAPYDAIDDDPRSVALDTLVDLCHNGDIKSCRAPFESSGFPDRIEDREPRWLADACSKGLGLACTRSGDFVKGCRASDPAGCFAAAKQDARRAAQWNKEGSELRWRLCDLGIAHDCSALTYDDLRRLGVDWAGDEKKLSQLRARTKELFLGDCRAADYGACQYIRPSSSGKPLPPLSPNEIDGLRIACYLNPNKCDDISDEYPARIRDIEIASEAAEIYCLEAKDADFSHALVCIKGAKLYLQQENAKSNVRVEAMMRRACELGNSEGCAFRPAR